MIRNSARHRASLAVRFHHLAFRIEAYAALADSIGPHSDLEWIQENVASRPQLPDSSLDWKLDRRTPCDGIVVLHRDASIHEALLAQQQLYTQACPCFSMHGDKVATLVRPSASEIVYDSELDVFYVVGRPTTTQRNLTGAQCVASVQDAILRVMVIAKEGQLSARIAVLRVLREIASQQMLASNWIPLHAAAVTFADRSVLILGERRSGKSTLMLQLLLEHEYDFLANDRVWIDALAPGGPQVYSIPCIISLRASSLALFASPSPTSIPACRLFDPVCCTWRARDTLAETIANPRGFPLGQPTTDLSLSPRQFLHLMQCKHVPHAMATTFLFPSIHDASGFEIQRLTPAECQAKLRENLFPVAPGVFFESTVYTTDLDGYLYEIAKSIPAFAFKLERGRRIPHGDLSNALMHAMG